MRARSLRFAGVTDLVAGDGWLTTRDASVEVGAGRSTGLATDTENGVTASTGVALCRSSATSLAADMERPNDNRGRGDDHHEQDEEHRQYLGWRPRAFASVLRSTTFVDDSQRPGQVTYRITVSTRLQVLADKHQPLMVSASSLGGPYALAPSRLVRSRPQPR